MFTKEDNTYNDIREKSLMQWLEEMEHHDDIAVRGGVKLCREYMQYLKDKNAKLQKEQSLDLIQYTEKRWYANDFIPLIKTLNPER